nr:serine/threonine-protein kinase [Pyxidicoccus parkwaysis]
MRRIGAGGMGEVFLAREESLRRACVVKKVLPQLMADPRFVGRFRDEARVMVRLAHPNIARVYAMGEVDGQLYLSMEYVQGKTLSRLAYRLRQLGRTIPLGVLLHLGQRLCEGLSYAHDAKDEEGHPLHLVHRDLSPANVCLSYAGEVKIIDFGAAQSTLKQEETAPRVVIGNLTYMSPEQARKRFVDRRADVYAAGALLWELVAWKPLPQRGDPVERWRRAAYPTWEPAGKFRQGVPSSLDALLMRALSPEPEHRFPDAAALGAELARIKLKLTPGVGDKDIAKLMESAFPREKVAEENALVELLREDASRKRTEREVSAVVLTPPNALAFEHSGIDTPEDFVPEEPTRVGVQGAQRAPGAERNAPGKTAMYGVGARGADVVTEALDASKVSGAVSRGADSAVTESMSASKVAGAVARAADVATEAMDASRVAAAVNRAADGATEALDASKVAGAVARATEGATEAIDASKVAGAVARSTDAATEALDASKVAGAVTEAIDASKIPAVPKRGAGTATEAVDANKVLVAIAQAESARNSGARPVPMYPGEENTVTPLTSPRGAPVKPGAPRRTPRETQVGFGVDISQTVDAASVEARRMELVRAITGEGEAVEPPPRARLPGRRALLAAGIFAGACALGLGVAWALGHP